ncbi:hypothetical protein BpHYR1_030431, partial [Brachionus plicatilis]
QDEIEKRERSDDVRKEMKRLREESVLKNSYESLDLIETNRVHKPSRQSGDKDILRKDFSHLSMDVILLVEGHNMIQYKYQAEHLFDHFELVHFSAPISRQTSTGQLCFVNKRLRDNFKFVADNCDMQANHTYLDDKDLVELSLFQLKSSSPNSRKSIYILSLYKHPSLAFGDFLKRLKDFLSKYSNVLSASTLLIMGDFNVDFNKEKEKSKLDKLIDMDLQPLFKNRATFEKGSQLDWAFVRLSPIDADDQQVHLKAKVLDTWFSDHSAIVSTIGF